MKVCIAAYDTYNNIGGVHSWVVRFAQQLIRSGVEASFVIYSSCTPEHRGTLEEILLAKNIAFRRTRYENETEANVLWTVEAVKELKATVLITNCMLSAWYAAPALESQGVPCIGVSHSDDPFYHALVEQCVTANGWYQMSGVVAVSQYLLDQATQAAGDLTKFERIPCGIDLCDTPQTTSERSCDSPFKLAYVGRFVEEQKQVSRLTELMCAAALEFPQFRGELIGAGPAETSMREIIQRHNCQSKIKIHGWLPEDRVTEHLASLDALALLSDYEGLPIALLEGMSVGLVPICSDIQSGVREVIKHGHNGFLIAPEAEAFTRTIGDLISNPDLQSRISSACRETIRGDFLNSVCTDRWIRFLKELVASFPSRPAVRAKSALPVPHPNLKGCDFRKHPQEETKRRSVAAIIHKFRRSIRKRIGKRSAAA